MFWSLVHSTKGCIIVLFSHCSASNTLPFSSRGISVWLIVKQRLSFYKLWKKKSQKNEISLPPLFPSISDIIDIYLLFVVKKNLLCLTSCFCVECGIGQMDRSRERIVWFSSVNLVSFKKKEKKQHFNWGFILIILSAWKQGLPQTSRSMISRFCYLLLISSGQLYVKPQIC